MSWRWVEHTGELELEIEAAAAEDVFGEALAAMRDLLEPDDESSRRDARTAPVQDREIELEAVERATLLADWLGELAFLAESEGLVPQELKSLVLDRNQLRATAEFRAGQPPHLVKGATYHRLTLEDAGDGVRATVVLDV